jgi:hypothetical protein
MTGYWEYDHKAPVAGILTVFASIEYPADEPPDSITIDGVTYVREGVDGDVDGQPVRGS